MVKHDATISDLPDRVNQDTVIILDTETTGLNKLTDKPFMLLMKIGLDYYSMKWSTNVAYWLNNNLPKAGVVVAHNAKYDWHMMRNGGVDPDVLYNTNIYCTMVCEALIDEHKLSYSLDNLGEEYFQIGKLDEALYEAIADVYGGKPDKKQMANVSKFATLSQDCWGMVARYGIRDIEITDMLWRRQNPLIQKQGLDRVVALEMKVLKALVEMEFRGVPVNMAKVDVVADQLTKKQNTVQQMIINEVGWMVNPRSPLEMEKAFRKLGIPITTSKTGKPTFAKDILEGLKDFPFIKMLQESRNIKTMVDTFINGSIRGNAVNGRIHTNFNQTRNGDAGTGCMPADTLVLTNHGMMPITSVEVGFLVIDHTGKPQKVIDWFENGIHQIHEITTAKGHTIKITNNHPVWFGGDIWVRAENLKVGDPCYVYGEPEVFKQIEGWPFNITSWGRVVSDKTRQTVKQHIKCPGKTWGHLKVTLCRGDCKRKNGNVKDFNVHRLVATYFCDNPHTPKSVTMHKNGISWDNNYINLAWGSTGENNNTGRDHGSYYHQKRLAQSDIDFIRSCSYLSQAQLGRAFLVSREMIRDIKNGKKWNRVPLVEKKLSFTQDTITSIRVLPSEMTYGIEVENTHTHLTNNIVTHNTGRMSSSEPNLQQIPKRDGELAPLIRGLFSPPKGYKWIAGDWEQFEFRVFAHYVKDADLTTRYNKDPHTDFHTALAEMTGKPRDKAKRINLGLVFGMGNGKLAKELGLPYNTEVKHGKEILTAGPEAMALFDEYHTRFPKAKEFLREASHLAKARGYVRTIMGRRLRFPGGEFVHKAGGLVFQGTSADFMKMKLVELNDLYRKTDVEFNIVVHDEFDLVCPQDLAERTVKEVKNIMEFIPELRIPILADVGVGEGWWEACKG